MGQKTHNLIKSQNTAASLLFSEKRLQHFDDLLFFNPSPSPSPGTREPEEPNPGVQYGDVDKVQFKMEGVSCKSHFNRGFREML
jgi:hypothetical protein